MCCKFLASARLKPSLRQNERSLARRHAKDVEMLPATNAGLNGFVSIKKWMAYSLKKKRYPSGLRQTKEYGRPLGLN